MASSQSNAHVMFWCEHNSFGVAVGLDFFIGCGRQWFYMLFRYIMVRRYSQHHKDTLVLVDSSYDYFRWHLLLLLVKNILFDAFFSDCWIVGSVFCWYTGRFSSQRYIWFDYIHITGSWWCYWWVSGIVYCQPYYETMYLLVILWFCLTVSRKCL